MLRKVFENNHNHFAPSITTFTLPTRPWTTPKVCATVIRASSWVNRSNLWRTVSISPSPSSFFVNFSAAHQATNNTFESALTEPTLFDLFGRQGKHRKKLDHYFDNDLNQHRSGRNHRIDFQTLEEIPQALEQFEKRIVARCNPTGSLAYSFITGEPFEKRVERTYSKESIDGSKQSVCWWEGDLTRSLLKSHQMGM